jgi:hypothetical protein
VARFSLGTSELASVAAGLLTIGSIFCVTFAPDISEWNARVEVRRLERAFGFTSGIVIVPDRNGGRLETWGIVTVTVGGPFARAGVRGGDVPFDDHGDGANSMLYALTLASGGEIGEFHVANAADWLTADGLRSIELPPTP